MSQERVNPSEVVTASTVLKASMSLDSARHYYSMLAQAAYKQGNKELLQKISMISSMLTDCKDFDKQIKQQLKIHTD